MKHILYSVFLLCLPFVIMGCDPIHNIKYYVQIDNANSDKITDEYFDHLVLLTEQVADKYNMEKKIIDNTYYYFGKYKTNEVRLKFDFELKNKRVLFEITDLFQISQSEISKKIEQDIINAMKKMYGTKFVLRRL